MTPVIVAAALWGLAEATLFFVVPDVLTSWLAVARGLRAMLLASLVAALAAALGGLLVVLAARHAPEATFSVIAGLPAIDARMMEATCARFAAANGSFAELLRGAFTGMPYKIFAACEGRGGHGLWSFVALTPLVRWPRFVLAGLIAHGLNLVARRWLSRRVRLGMVAAFWSVFYAAYWSVMP